MHGPLPDRVAECRLEADEQAIVELDAILHMKGQTSLRMQIWRRQCCHCGGSPDSICFSQRRLCSAEGLQGTSISDSDRRASVYLNSM